jgi:hypothetical protein
MKHQSLIVALTALGLSGCAYLWPEKYGSSAPIRNEVSFEGGKISTKLPIILVPANLSEVTLEWQLANSKDVTFPENGIVIEGAVVFPTQTVPEVKGRAVDTPSLRIDPQQKSNFVCVRQEDRLKFSCTSKQLVGGVYKYTIRVQKGTEIQKVDPPIVIMRAV